MIKNFDFAEEVVADEHFQAWYSQNDPAKADMWKNWLAANPQQVIIVNEAIEWMDSFSLQEAEPVNGQLAAAHERLLKSIGAGKPAFAEALAGKEKAIVIPIQRKPRRWMWAAAAAVLMITAGSYLWLNRSGTVQMQTAYGQLSEHLLPDGSEVTLNANSTITISNDWDDNKDREVWIKGEAFFKVKKTPALNRFIVHTDQFDVIVTGTQFNVVNRNDKNNVMLTEGSVTILTKDGKDVVMKPGDFVEFNDKQVEKKPAKEEQVLAWKYRRLDFENTPFSEMIRIISEHYGVTVKLGDPGLANKTITAILPNDNLDVLLKALEATNDFKISKNKNEILIARP